MAMIMKPVSANVLPLNSRLAANVRQKEFFVLASFLRRMPPSQFIQMNLTSTLPKEEHKTENIPSLPVQPLEQMMEKYLKSIKPFVNSTQLQNTQKLAKSFCEDENLGRKLQNLLQQRAAKMDNWLADWWLATAYLEYRNPVVVYSSPGLVWPEQKFKNQKQQLMFTASLIAGALDFNRLIEEKKIPQEKLGGKPLCMSQYQKIFGTCRVPKIPKDDLLFLDPKNPSRNIVVMYNNHIFTLPVFKEGSRKPLSASQFYAMLVDVVQQGEGTPGKGIGVLTTAHRDVWAKAYEMLKQNEGNKQMLEDYVEKSLFVVCLDKPLTLGSGLNYHTRGGKLLLHGFGNRGNAANRWYDKTVQFVIGALNDGVGVAYEHSPAEGGPIGVLTDHVMARIKVGEELQMASDYPKPQKLDFSVLDAVEKEIALAGQAIDKLNDELDVCNWSFQHFGKGEIKKLRVSPDSFIQIAIQLAFYKLHDRPAAQYESGSLRKFIYGRTDTIRTCSEEVVSCCRTMVNPNATKEEKAAAIRSAISSHKKFAEEVLDGRGVDRHLLGLKILAKLNNMKNPEIFSDVAFIRSTNFQLSTSNVPTKCDGLMVYGPLVDDGYACCYNPREGNINFGTSAWAGCKQTRLSGFNESLEEALMEMKNCLSVTQSKL